MSNFPSTDPGPLVQLSGAAGRFAQQVVIVGPDGAAIAPGVGNIVTIELAFTTVQTDVAIVTVSAGTRIVVIGADFTVANSNSVDTAVRVGFGLVNTPTTTGVILSHPGVAAGSGIIKSTTPAIGEGADGEDLRITASVPTNGSGRVVISYYLVTT